MPCRVYVHFDEAGYKACTSPVEVSRPADMQFGTVKQAFIGKIVADNPDMAAPNYGEYCFWNQDSCPIADQTPIATFAWEHNDFFLRPLPAEGSAGGALDSSQRKKGELSYYYAHDRGGQRPLTSNPPASAMPAAPRNPVPQAKGPKVFNSKQSPFGTDITGYETITSYTWEDKDGDTVKVLVPLDGVGKLEPHQVRSAFGDRSFELLVDGLNGKKLRFACYKTHGEMKVAECKHVVRANRVNLILKKAKEKDIWFDLFKKRAIGDDDDP